LIFVDTVCPIVYDCDLHENIDASLCLQNLPQKMLHGSDTTRDETLAVHGRRKFGARSECKMCLNERHLEGLNLCSSTTTTTSIAMAFAWKAAGITYDGIMAQARDLYTDRIFQLQPLPRGRSPRCAPLPEGGQETCC